MFAWACTFHKVQGLSLPQIVVSFQLLKQRNFNYGQIYVALSRVMCFQRFYILDSFTVKAIRADPQAFEEYNRLCLESMLVRKKDNFVDKKRLMITILRSLNKHAVDLPCDKRLKRSDIMCLTETQLQQDLSLSESYMLEEFNMIYINNCDKFQSIAYGFRNDIDILLHNRMRSASLVSFSKSTFKSKTIKLLLLYRKHSINVTGFCSWLQEFVTSNFVDIILRDFNISVFDETDRLSNVLASYNQIIKKPTHISGSLLDHVYFHCEFLEELDVQILLQ